MIVEAFAGMPDKKLVVIGDGPCMAGVRAKAGPNVEIKGYQPFDRLLHYMQRARAFIFAAEEDFGIVLVEAQACGTPVIAFGRGGALEIVRGLDAREPTGIFFERQDPDCLREAVATFEANWHRFSPEACRANAENFSRQRFRNGMSAVITREMARLKAFRPFRGESLEGPGEWRTDGLRSANGAL
jgi:glycosyltransferase involved in cell wall biosynthesis